MKKDFPKITTHLLVKNDSDTIEAALKSLLPLGGDIIVGDLGSEDDTPQICHNYGAKVIEITLNNNFSKVRNSIVSNNSSPWQLFIEPWEVLAMGYKTIIDIDSQGVYGVQVLQGDIINKEARLWHKSTQLQFMQPVYEILNNKNPEQQLPGVIIYSNKPRENWDEKEKILKIWEKENPLSKEPCYYKAFTMLGKHNYKDFITNANEYLFKDSVGMSAIMLQYYLSLVQLHSGDMKSAVKGAVGCIITKPLMSEFWCLLGDIYYKSNHYDKAIVFYENAIDLGRRRLQSDAYPMEISKYKTYPTKMIENCKTMLYKSIILKRI